MHLKQFTLIGLIAALVIATGCTTVSRGVGKMTFNKYADPRSGTVWVIPPPDLAPPSPGQRNIYVSYRNISDAPEIDLTGPLRQAIAERGWTLTDDPGVAHYRLRATLRYFGEVEPDSGARILRSRWAASLAPLPGSGLVWQPMRPPTARPAVSWPARS